MKKLLTLLPLSLVMAACATSPTTTAPSAAANKAYDRMAPEQFICEDNATVNAKYSIDGEQATINASLPKANWNNQTVIMDIAQAASGSRYVNNASQNVTYDWHTKGDLGIMRLTWADGTEYAVKCERR
ncbi:MliC family protein [Psychrobacter phenylpyruvicus]|uniref:Membrane-bound lysozyme-inhibitor of c-type lysozyme n=1 Tax=Psychrobacter phenylpyruvicus TaxID=29432 RepID=A0A379LP65_9GAMM|nr:MliC family protein [Psychrobacter phenylpyruvicus]SUD91657.1 Membrane-bound lysozyme-inhibitor of c-type lysozyme [Psychrobacter phenylpyruvicus]